MTVDEYLAEIGLDATSVVKAVQAVVGLSSSDMLLAVGSLAEGIGNRKSDLDVLVITDDDGSASAVGQTALSLGRHMIDIQVLSSGYLRAALARLADWDALPWCVWKTAGRVLEDRRLLHRVLNCSILLEGRGCWWSVCQPSQQLARLKLQVARRLGRTVQVDMVGAADVGDYRSLVFVAQDLLGHAIDALTAGYLLSNPSSKWRSRLLERLPLDWNASLPTRPTSLSASDYYWALHRAPRQPEGPASVKHALRISTFARAVFLWSEFKLLGGTPVNSGSLEWREIEGRSKDVLPALHIDVDFVYSGPGKVALGRLNESGQTLELSNEQIRVALLFDGITLRSEAELAISGDSLSDIGAGVVDRLQLHLKQAGLCMPRSYPNDERDVL